MVHVIDILAQLNGNNLILRHAERQSLTELVSFAQGVVADYYNTLLVAIVANYDEPT